MGHTELRPVDDDDHDAIYEMMRDRDSVALVAFTATDPGDRDAFELWMVRRRAAPDVSFWVVTENGGFAGTAVSFDVDGDRELSFWIARHARGRGVGREALRQLISREAERPLFARAAAHNAGAIAVLESCGFTEVSRSTSFAPGAGRDVEELVLTLVPALDGI